MQLKVFFTEMNGSNYDEVLPLFPIHLSSLIRQMLTVDLPSAYFPIDRAFLQFFHTEINLTFVSFPTSLVSAVMLFSNFKVES